jgi:IS5 family transposase
MKLHIGTDTRGTVHSVTATHAGAADITQLADLLHGEERVLFGDQAYWSEFHRLCAAVSGVRYRVNRRAAPGKKLSDYEKRVNRSRSRSRARGEHPFRVIKQLWGFTKVRYRGIAKNLCRAQVAFALGNLYALRRKLIPRQARCAL